MTKQNDQLECPVGETACRFLDEVGTLRDRVAELAELVHTDTLTGLFNYRHFVLALEREMERTERTGQPTSLIMLDLDHFKGVNDTWGHEAGNRVLQHLAHLLHQLLRRIDVACRYGGEEFAVILPATPLARAVRVAERLRLALASAPIMEGDEALRVTMSLGVGVHLRNSGLNPKRFIEQVDKYLYEAKQLGRNRVAHPGLEAGRPKGQVGPDEKAALFE